MENLNKNNYREQDFKCCATCKFVEKFYNDFLCINDLNNIKNSFTTYVNPISICDLYDKEKEMVETTKYFINDPNISWRYFEVETSKDGLINIDLEVLKNITNKSKIDIIEYLEWVMFELQHRF
jgi:hypothetical protein